MKHLSPLALILLFHFTSPAQKTPSDDNGSTIAKEMRQQEKAKHGNLHPTISVITDPQKVHQLGASIAPKPGSTTTESLPETMTRLRRLSLENPDAFTTAFKNRELSESILTQIDNPAYEKDAVYLAGKAAIPGYEEKFEKRFLSGRSTIAAQIFYFLGISGKRTSALAYFATLVEADNFRANSTDLYWYILGLSYFGKNGNADIRATVGHIAWAIQDKKLVHYSSDPAAEPLRNTLIAYGGQRADSLVRQHTEDICQMLKNKDEFYKGLEGLETPEDQYRDEKSLTTLLQEFAKRKEIGDELIQRIVYDYQSWNAKQYLTRFQTITGNARLAAKIRNYNAIDRAYFDNILVNLQKAGLLQTPPEKSTIDHIMEECRFDSAQFIFDVLNTQNIYLSFDIERDFTPVDYDKLFADFAAKSEGILGDIKIAMDTTTVTVIYKEKAYIAKPQKIDDWYDMMTVNALLNKLLEHSGSKKRFVYIDIPGDQYVKYIFGNPEPINMIIQKYRLGAKRKIYPITTVSTVTQ